MEKKINKNEIIIFSVILIILIVILIVVITKNNNKDDNKNNEILLTNQDEQIPSNIIMQDEEFAVVESNLKINTSEKLKEEKTYNDLAVKDAQIVAGGRYCSFEAVVKNNLEKDTEGEIVNIVFVDKENKEITKLETQFPDTLAGQENMITGTTMIDISNSYDYYIERK